MTKLNISLMQASGESRSPEQAMATLATNIARAAKLGADVLVTPELYLSGYGDATETAEWAQYAGSTLLRQAAGLAAQYGIALVLGYPEKTDDGVFNSAVVFGTCGETLSNYRKINLPNDYERSCFKRGSAPLVFDIVGVRCAVLICYDIEFPEMARLAAELGAELLIVPTALGTKWRIVSDSLIPVRAYENGVFVAYCNFASESQPQQFTGLSTICGPDGRPAIRAETRPGLFTAMIDTDDIGKVRAELTFLLDLALMRAAHPVGET
jgi:predicted amidohydrolase